MRQHSEEISNLARLAEEVKHIATAYELGIEIVEPDEGRILRTKVVNRFVKPGNSRWLWECLIEEHVSINDNEAWHWIPEFTRDETVYLFFSEYEEQAMFRLHGQDALRTLLEEEEYGFEYYLTNEAVDYLLCYNHHDYLIACGTAMDWLISKSDG